MDAQIDLSEQLKTLQGCKVTKRAGETTPFYAYKLDLIMRELGADLKTQETVYQTLLQQLGGQDTIATVDIAHAMVDGFRKAGHEEYSGGGFGGCNEI